MVSFEKKHLQTMGLKVSKQNKITHFFLINVIKMYNDIFLEKQLGFMDILHINKQKKITF
jgi:hypothetical protein